MLNALQHPVITRLQIFGYEYDEPPICRCGVCGRELLPEDMDFFGEYPEVCWECECGKDDESEEMEA